MRVSVEPAIVVDGLCKRYGGVAVVDGVSFVVPTGAVVALLGPNGAGKTTTVECVEGFRTPDAGTVRVLGHDPHRHRDAVTASLGVMLQEGGAYPAATPVEMLRLYARFHPDPWPVDDLLARLGLDEVAARRFRSLSGGEKQRLNLALALVGHPRVLILDEPTAGMDPQARRRTWMLIRRLRDDGVAVLLTTHFMEEAERLADLVAVIDRGRLVALDSPATLIAGAPSDGVLVTTPAAIDPVALAAAVGAPVDADGQGRWIVGAGAEVIPAVSAWFAARRLPLTGVSAAGRGLEDVFLRLTSDRGRR